MDGGGITSGASMFDITSRREHDRQSVTLPNAPVQKKCGDELLGLGRIGVVAIDAETVSSADEFVVDDLTREVGVFLKGGGVTVRAVSRDACGIAQLRPSFTHPLGEAENAFLAAHEGRAGTAPSRVRNDGIGSAADGSRLRLAEPERVDGITESSRHGNR